MPLVEIRGNVDLRKALKNFTPDLEKELRKELRAALKPVVRQAKGFVPAVSPMRGWAGRSFSEGKFPTYNAGTIISGITYSVSPSKPNKNGFTSMARIINKSAVGAIYETAGRKNPNGQAWVGPKAGGVSKGVSRSNNPNAGKQFIQNLPPIISSLKGRGRLIYRAWAENRGVAEGAAMKAIDSATQQFYARAKTTTFKKAA
jgi:hypothetical protein